MLVFFILQTPWEEVRSEMVNEKGLTEEIADKIGEYVRLKGECSHFYIRR